VVLLRKSIPQNHDLKTAAELGVKLPESESPKLSEERFDQYTNIINPLVSECVICSPSEWQNGTLTIDCDGNAINYKLKNSESEEKAQISSALRSLCEELYVVMRQNGDIWVEAIIYYFKNGESWSFKIDFVYPNKNQIAVSSATRVENQNNAELVKNKAWWKLW
jgi:hypothetical protein